MSVSNLEYIVIIIIILNRINTIIYIIIEVIPLIRYCTFRQTESESSSVA